MFPSPLKIITICIAFIAVIPVLAVLSSLSGGFSDVQNHIWSTRGGLYLKNTVSLCLFTGLLATIFGGGCAILVTLFEFPMRRIMSVTLILPFAVPAYIAAYSYGGLLPAPLAQHVRSLEGAAVVLAATTYPYIYLAVRASLIARSATTIEAARSLGASTPVIIATVIVPLVRAAFAGGVALVLMETAADFGVADYVGIPTLSVGIFRTWYGMGSLEAASQLAAGLFIIALFLVLLERVNRKGRTNESAHGGRRFNKIRLSPIASTVAILWCLIPVGVGFLGPVALLLSNADWSMTTLHLRDVDKAFSNTVLISIVTAIVVSVAALILAYEKRTNRSRGLRLILTIATLGYALPGAVVAIGVLIAGSAVEGPLWLTSGTFALVFAYSVRFLTIGYNSADAGLAQVNIHLDDAAKNLGATGFRILKTVHAPLASKAIFAGALLVIIDVAKELPATLLLRSFNFETLATQIYHLSSDERIAEAAPICLLLIIVSLINVALLLKANRSS